jgi:hypothetical protein
MTKDEKMAQVARLEAVRNDGGRAAQIIKDPVVVAALGEMRQTLVKNLESSPWHAHKERQEIYRMLKTIGHFEHLFERRINDGKFAQGKLSQLINKVRGRA